MQVRILLGAPPACAEASAGKAFAKAGAVNRGAILPNRSALLEEPISRALSSEAERRSHVPKVGISKFSARTNTASLAQWQSAAATWPRSQDRSLQDAPIGPVTVAAERRGILTRWLKPVAGSNPAWSTSLRAKASVPQPAEGVRRERIQWEFDSLRTHQPSRPAGAAAWQAIAPLRIW